MRWIVALALGVFAWTGVLAGDRIEVVRAWFDDPALVAKVAPYHSHLIVHRDKGLLVLEADAAERARLVELGFRIETDLEATAALHAPLTRAPQQTRGIAGFPCYRTVAEATAWLDALPAQYPALASVIDIGDSWEKGRDGVGEDVRVLRLTSAATPGPKPSLFAMSAIHAREFAPGELGARFAEWLLAGYGVDPQATWILDHQEVHLLVHANPDGRKRAESQSGGSGNSAQRKNLNRDWCGSGRLGIDLNRNWPFEWGQHNGSSGNACDDTFRGPAPASEPETLATYDYVRTLFADQRGALPTDPAPAATPGLFFDLHSYSSLVLWPWGYTASVAPNGPALETLGRRLAWFNGYAPSASVELYVTDGTTDDTAYGELGVAAYTFELGSAFFQSCASFEADVLPANLAALVYAARVTRAPYLLPSGPEARAVAVAPDLAFPGETIAVTALIDDTRFNQGGGGTEPANAIAGASAYLDTPPWAAGAVPHALLAADGAWNSAQEAASGTIALAGVPTGKRLVFVQGADTTGAAGAPAAAFVTVSDPATVGTLSGAVRDAQTNGPVVGASIATGPWRASSGVGGAYARRLPAGSHAVDVSAPGYDTAALGDIAIAGGATATRDAVLFPRCRRLQQDAESGAAGWTTQAVAARNVWSIVQPNAVIASRAWTESAAGNYVANGDSSLISPLSNLTGFTDPRLTFDSYCDSEAGFDFGRVEFRAIPTGAWTEAFRCSGKPQFERVELALPALAGAAQAQVRFRFTSDSGLQDDGWYVDNIVLDANGPACRALLAPAAPAAPDLDPGSDSGDSSGDDVTNAAVARFSGTCSDGDRIDLRANGIVAGSVDCTSGTYAIDVAPPEGAAIAYTASIVRNTLESAASAPLAVTVDRTPPPTPSLVAAPVVEGTPATIAGAMAENAGRVEVRAGSTPVCTTGALGPGAANQWSCAATLPVGRHPLRARQVDVAGNAGADTGIVHAVVAPPPPARPDLDPASDSGQFDDDDVSNASQSTFTGACVAGDTVVVLADGVPLGAGVVCAQGTYAITAVLPEATTIAIATRVARNGVDSAASAALAVTVDRTAPVAPVVQGPATAEPLTTFTGSMAENAGHIVVLVDGADACSTAPLTAASAYAWRCDTGLAGAGTYEVRAYQVDVAGNVGAASAALTATVQPVLLIDGFEAP